VALAAVGGAMMSVAIAIVGAFVLALLFWQLMANVVMIAFKQELHWYGPGVYTAGGDLWWYVFAIAAVGIVLFVPGMTMLDKAGAPLRRPGKRRPA
jgi:hypothetical protein